MARGNEIIVSANPRGVFHEGVIGLGLTPKPGTIMQIQTSAGISDDGRMTWELATPGTDGYRPIGPLAVLLHDSLRGKLTTDAYAAGDRCFLYTPVAGEELNCLLGDVGGTGDDHSFGEVLIVDTGTGELIATTGSVESEPFILLEDVTDPTADTLAHVMYTGY